MHSVMMAATIPMQCDDSTYDTMHSMTTVAATPMQHDNSSLTVATAIPNMAG